MKWYFHDHEEAKIFFTNALKKGKGKTRKYHSGEVTSFMDVPIPF